MTTHVSTTAVDTTQAFADASGGNASEVERHAVAIGLQKRLLQAVTASPDKRAVVSAIGRVVADYGPLEHLVYFYRDGSNMLIPTVLAPEEDSTRHDPTLEPFNRCAKEACSQGCPKIVTTKHPQGPIRIAVPVNFRGSPPEALAVELAVQTESLEAWITVLQLAAVHVTLWQVLQDYRAADSVIQSAAALEAIIEKLESSPDAPNAYRTLVNEVRQYTNCRQVALAVRLRRRGRCRLKAVSGVANFSEQAPLALAIESALGETLLRESSTIWPPPSSSDRHAALAHHKLCTVAHAASVVSLPLWNKRGELMGAWLFLGDEEDFIQPNTLAFLRTAGTRAASCLSRLHRFRGGPLALIRRWGRQPSGAWHRKAVLVALAASIACLFLPMHYKIGCDCRLEPVSRRFVAAPYDGILEKVYVGPGDMVAEGRLLARMNGRELRWELAGVVTQQKRAEKQHRAAFANHEFAAAEVAALEAQRLELTGRLIEDRQRNLDIKSPIRGIVTLGDIEKAEGAPVTRGQTLFEVAPLDEMIVEVAIPENEIDHVRIGAETTIRLDSDFNTTFNGTIAKIHPRAEIRGNQNVFIAQFTLANSAGTLRPGMRGRAKILGPRRALAWNLFHKPWEWLCLRLGW